MTGPFDGYYAAPEEIRLRRAGQFGDERDHVEEQRAALEQVFLREGMPLGDDQYGAELEKNLPKIKDSIFGAFKAYTDELESVRVRLITGAGGYRSADSPGFSPGA
ncbi:hypothetical protein [Streptosporangium sp. NPDC003464]